MTIDDLKIELRNWKLTRYKIINFTIGICALLIYEFIARPYYRPYIYSHKINDFHIADTLGNSLGTLSTIFILVSLLSYNKERGINLVKMGTLALVLYEVAHPLLGKPIDLWDILATALTGILSYIILYFLFEEGKNKSRKAK